MQEETAYTGAGRQTGEMAAGSTYGAPAQPEHAAADWHPPISSDEVGGPVTENPGRAGEGGTLGKAFYPKGKPRGRWAVPEKAGAQHGESPHSSVLLTAPHPAGDLPRDCPGTAVPR